MRWQFCTLPTYAEQNAGSLRQDWPRIPLPANLTALQTFRSIGAGKLQRLWIPRLPFMASRLAQYAPNCEEYCLLSRAWGEAVSILKPVIWL